MKKKLLIFAASLIICVFGTILLWLTCGNSNDLRDLSDYFFLSGVLFLLIGMIIALAATSRRHYYRHVKDKLKGKVETDSAFEKKAKERKNRMWIGIFIALTGIVAVAASGYIAARIGY
ncbi:MAG: hypothetical protein LBH98_02555 [Chitinispirillales bacterium]|jgi:hypothetical protein|nr:hypothetical protein [Chitinispirillales bacterium]